MTVATLEKIFKTPSISSQEVKWFYTHFPPIQIDSRNNHSLYKKVVVFLFENGHTHGEFSPYLQAVIHFMDEYEQKRFPAKATPEDILHFLMEQHNLTQTELAKYLGGQSVVSNILNGKRQLTREHIEKLSSKFSISPASFYQR